MPDNYIAVLLEDMNSKFDFVLENIVPDIRTLKEDMQEMKTIAANHEQRITSLEADQAA